MTQLTQVRRGHFDEAIRDIAALAHQSVVDECETRGVYQNSVTVQITIDSPQEGPMGFVCETPSSKKKP